VGLFAPIHRYEKKCPVFTGGAFLGLFMILGSVQSREARGDQAREPSLSGGSTGVGYNVVLDNSDHTALRPVGVGAFNHNIMRFSLSLLAVACAAYGFRQMAARCPIALSCFLTAFLIFFDSILMPACRACHD